MQKSLLQIFVLTCKNVYFEPKFNLNGKILRQGFNEGFWVNRFRRIRA